MTEQKSYGAERKLYLVRHAKSAWDDPSLHDFERPLNERGRRDAPRMAQHLAQQTGTERPVLLSSPAVRAITTARCFAEALGIDPRSMRVDARLYEASAGDWLEVLQQQNDDWPAIAAFGHNPGISRLAAWLCAELEGLDMPTTTVVGLATDRGWSELTPGCAWLLSITRPKDLAGQALP